MFNNKILLITGGTGSFGNAVLKRFLNTNIKEIRIFSRDEKKQENMRLLFNHPKLKFYIGDVRNYASIHQAMKEVDYVFHAAALKQVPSCEFYPMEAVQTNILGAENVMNAAIANHVERIISIAKFSNRFASDLFTLEIVDWNGDQRRASVGSQDGVFVSNKRSYRRSRF